MHRAQQLWSLLRGSVMAWIDDDVPSLGAALAFYMLFAIAPLLLIVIAVGGLIFGRDAAQGHILIQLRELMGENGALAVQSLLESASDRSSGVLAVIIGTVTFFVAATTVFAELRLSLNRIWRAPARRRNAVKEVVVTRVVSLGMILSFGLMLLLSLVLSAALTAIGAWWSVFFVGWGFVLQAANLVLSFSVTTLIFALIFKFLPQVRLAWREVWVGATVTAVLVVVGKLLIALYLGSTGVGSAFGAAGSLVVLLLWIYYTAQILLLGAEFTWLYAHRYGSRRELGALLDG
ncbi:MAG: YihY/virulence factor BrkB family protein, partial [Myxococcota bacterium]|nr:YihY/virulence factor BrkB family protein [Myxococcota bacterium]